MPVTTNQPRRIRLSRAPGFRLADISDNYKVVSRPSRWGNPFTITECLEDDSTLADEEARARCVRLFQDWLTGEYVASGLELQQRRDWILDNIGELAGRDLACWCKTSEPCHADVLLEAAAKAALATRGAGHENNDTPIVPFPQVATS